MRSSLSRCRQRFSCQGFSAYCKHSSGTNSREATCSTALRLNITAGDPSGQFLSQVPGGPLGTPLSTPPPANPDQSGSPNPQLFSERKKGPYFEFAKKKWETEDTFRLPDGSYWPEVTEGIQSVDHGIVICKLCSRHHKANNFAGEGYRHVSGLVSCINGRHHAA